MRNSHVDSLRRSESAIRSELKAAGVTFKGKACRCPFHDDKHASAGIYCDEGVWKFKCQSVGCGFGGDVFDIRAKIQGKPVADVLRAEAEQCSPEPAKATTPRVYPTLESLKDSTRNCTAIYVYSHPGTKAPEMIVLRVDEPGGKRFLQASPCPGGFCMSAPPKPWPIYNRTRVADADEVVFVEGEKCVHSLHSVGIVATTTPGGAGKAQHADLSPLAGKRVYLWPDADPPNPPDKPNPGMRTGIEHMRDIAARLQTLTPAPTLFWVDCDSLGLNAKGDAADFIDAGGDADAVRAVLDSATSMGASGDLRSRVGQIASGNYAAIDWPWPMLGRGTQALTPGSITLIAGDPGSTKSFLLLEACAWWHEQGIPMALFEVEKDRRWHLNRALAQRANEAMLTDLQWVRDNPDYAEHLVTTHAAWLDSFGGCIHDRAAQGIKIMEMAEWIDRMGASGKRIICVDPISLCIAGRDRFVADEAFMSAVEPSVNRHGVSLILVTHPTKNSHGAPSLGNVCGGAVYERSADTVIWVTRQDEPKQVTIAASASVGSVLPFKRDVTCNRVIALLKTRNGRGNGWKLAYQFSGENLRFSELGGIVQKRSNRPDDESEVA